MVYFNISICKGTNKTIGTGVPRPASSDEVIGQKAFIG